MKTSILILIAIITTIAIKDNFSSPPPTGVESVSAPELYKVTAYCACSKCCGAWADGYTASGHKISKGDRFVATPSSIPFGTRLRIAGYAEGQSVRVLDRGGAIKGNRLDVYFDTHQEALNWGVKYIEVEGIDQ